MGNKSHEEEEFKKKSGRNSPTGRSGSFVSRRRFGGGGGSTGIDTSRALVAEELAERVNREGVDGGGRVGGVAGRSAALLVEAMADPAAVWPAELRRSRLGVFTRSSSVAEPFTSDPDF